MSFTPIWGVPIALYLFLAGLGGGAFITAFCLRQTAPDDTVKTRKFAHYAAFIVVAVGLVLLMFDAKAGFHNPLRFALLLNNFGSWMTWGVVFLAVFEIVDLIVCILDIRNKNVPKWLEIVGVVFGVCVGIYTGALLATPHTFPLWNSAILPILFLVSAVSTGAALTIGYGALCQHDEFEHMEWVENAHFFLPIIEMVLVFFLMMITYSNGEAGVNSVLNLVSGAYAGAFWFGFVIIGLVAPFIADLFLKHMSGSGKRGGTVAADVMVIVGGFMLRYLIIVAALPVTLVVPAML